MATLRQALQSVLHGPKPEDLVALQEAMLAHGPVETVREQEHLQRALQATGHFFTYLLEIRSKLSAREYSQLASWLDIGAVGAVAFEGLLTGKGTMDLPQIIAGSLAESLMVLASRQYVKAWDAESHVIHEKAAWHLRQDLWYLSMAFQPDLDADARLAVIRQSLVPVLDQEQDSTARIVLLARLYQGLLQVYVSALLQET